MLDKRFSAKLGFVGPLQFISVRCDIHPHTGGAYGTRT